MKNYSKIIALLLTISLVTTSCFKKIKEELLPSGSATLIANGTSVDLGTPTAITALGVVTIEANKNKSGYTILLNKTDIKAGKVYDLKSSTGVFTFFHEGTYYSPSTGNLEITKFTDNKVVEGKFSFDGNAVGNTSKKMTASGYFSINIIF
ncbi:hypothetical protein Emtol_0694 [Emticicia oligotrophica DSM 17448]|uniref:DUF4402 domain-containing protein n=1 Tax=Emticicia oligotrophica (strain DSM 17448 / CIP 109782 / MTCC 6937 / GPTSA100-15) TaxID=929562 RepID=A0ABM5MXG5_EMTOG|nr:hypothetical protein [Emticicia oligotrophica]AFK01847.1 hypothetical protein Emtol_0694 [Emticicia oligotrophica DSM 17448]